jgi:bifunctional UDP-N-acetylglucosamine pyrophosphorylase/glucosamine-1-phosphate N-acetyltransferase
MPSSAALSRKAKPSLPPKTASDLAVVILAAGKGTRMKSAKSKVLHEIAGLPMIRHIVRAAEQLKPKQIVTVIAPGMDDVAASVAPYPVAFQKEQKGTGDALKSALAVLGDFKGQILVLYGDVPLVSPATLKSLLQHHRKGKGFGATVLAMAPPDPKGYGRIFQNPDGTLSRIVEEADASADEKLVRMCNSGLMVLEGGGLAARMKKIRSNNSQGEYYLIDIIGVLAKEGLATGVIRGDYYELRGVNSRAQLAELEQAWQNRKRLEVMADGVTLIDPNAVYFHWDTKIGADTLIEPNVMFGPGVEVEEDVHIRAFCHIEGARIKSGAAIGPFARLRPGADIGEGAKIGNFVEVKNAKIGKGAKANHLGYIGDAELGDHSNFGCGAITVNYDGLKKSRTVIGKNVMIGSNASLIAPITVEDGAYIAAGSTLSKDIPADALAISRAETKILAGRGKGRMKKE